MRKMVCFVMAFAMVLGFTQCKKDQPEPQNESEGNQVRITLNVNNGNNGSRANVDPTASPMVTFESGDQIIVSSGGHYVGYLEHDGSGFTGTITDPVVGKPLFFYFLGNKVNPLTELTVGVSDGIPVDISDQTDELPVISIGSSINASGDTVYYSTGMTSFTSRLSNKCSLMKFNVTAPSTAPICITGMANAVTVSFKKQTAGQGYLHDGLIMMKGVTASNPVTYAVVFSQEALAEGAPLMTGPEALLYTADHFYSTTRPAIPEIRNGYLYDGPDAVTLTEENSTYDALETPLTFEARTAGARVTFNIYATVASNPVEYNVNAYGWQTYTSGTAIELENVGDKVMFRGSNNFYSQESDSKFSCSGSCFIYGNIMSLIDKVNFPTATSMPTGQAWNQHVFQGLFADNTNIDIHSSRDLVLPATELVDGCYSRLFYGCTSLTKAPELPAEELATSCYYSMFTNCSNLETAPVLRAETLAHSCYCNMFENCAKINSITCFATSTGGENDFTRLTQWWLSGVASTGTFITPATSVNWPTDSPHGIPAGWTREDYVAPTE